MPKFISGGAPLNLESDGSAPTGSAPIMFHRLALNDAASAFLTNQGTGGSFSTVAGALTATVGPTG